MTVWYLPIEPLAQRYTEQMHKWVVSSLRDINVPFKVVSGGDTYKQIKHGEWLDTIGSTFWKLNQVRSLTEAIASGAVDDGDIVLLGDVWHQGIEAIKFQSLMLGLNLQFAGWHYAGCFDHFDLLARSLGKWGKKYEATLFEGLLDSVNFGSEFHRSFVASSVNLPNHVRVDGLAWDHLDVASYVSDKRMQRIVFPHRWANEKRWWEFCLAAKRYGKDLEFVFSTNGNVSEECGNECLNAGIRIVQHDSKASYYSWLAQSAAIWSGADQETFGYSFMEAVALKVNVIAPHRACYPNHFERLGLDATKYLYGQDDPYGQKRIEMLLEGNLPLVPIEVSKQYDGNAETYIESVLNNTNKRKHK